MKRNVLCGIIFVTLLAGQIMALELSETQAVEMQKIGKAYAKQAKESEGVIAEKLSELVAELQREGRLESEEAAEKASENINVILHDLGQLYGQFIKTKVEFVVEAKNILTPEQKMLLLSQVHPQKSVPFEKSKYMQPEIFRLPINLSLEQERQIILLEAELAKNDLDVEHDVAIILVDLRALLFSGMPQSEKVDPLISRLADLAAQTINNRMDFFIQASEVLTLDQRRMLSHMLGLN